MDYLIIGILFFIGNVVWSIAFLFYQSYAKKKGENVAVKEDSKEIAMLTELGKNMATKSDIHEITLIAERTKNEAAKESAQSISYEEEKGKNLATKEDIEEITKGMEIIKNEISFENQRKHNFIEARTERFINILNRAGEIQSYQATLMYYLYNNSSVDRIMDLIEQINKDMQIITYETRMILVSFEDVSPLTPLSNLNDNVFRLGTEICVHASHAISYITNWNKMYELHMQTKEQSFIEKAIENKNKLEYLQKNISYGYKDKVQKNMEEYILLLHRLFGNEIFIKYTIKPEH
ncbi:hypothetical protein [uncultured Bacteroides sp.]|uniref:hypothetical protein n=1 Tax=uncultured Bacteroides sp. TaxID=162156 RepID=UPI0025E43058|nr:hypothetical protein [uncultured Bacteroides sp.]